MVSKLLVDAVSLLGASLNKGLLLGQLCGFIFVFVKEALTSVGPINLH